MDANTDELTISISAFKKETDAVLQEAGLRPIAVLRNGTPVFYALSPALYEAILDELGDMGLHLEAIEALAEQGSATEVEGDEP
jgi:antitoxin StbD